MPTSRNRLGAALIGVGLLACQRADPAINEKLDTIIKKVDALEGKVTSLEQKIGQMPAAGRPAAPGPQPPRPMPAQPDPALTYAVPIDGDPVKGPATALVTVVGAAEFA